MELHEIHSYFVHNFPSIENSMIKLIAKCWNIFVNCERKNKPVFEQCKYFLIKYWALSVYYWMSSCVLNL